jgi:hypothetical protein
MMMHVQHPKLTKTVVMQAIHRIFNTGANARQQYHLAITYQAAIRPPMTRF